MTEFNDMQRVKRNFFALRNGIVADTLRNGGSPFPVIFGLNLPQIVEIAAVLGINQTLGRKLWADRRTRESMLLAPMLFSPAEVTAAEALEMLQESPAVEVTDVLCHRLLRHIPAPETVAREALAPEAPDMLRYGAIRLLWNLPASAALLRPLVQEEAARGSNLTWRPAAALLDELDFLAQA